MGSGELKCKPFLFKFIIAWNPLCWSKPSLLLKLYCCLAMGFNQGLLNMFVYNIRWDKLYLITLAHGKIEQLSCPVAGWHLSDYFHCQFKWQRWRNPICVLGSLGKRQGAYSVCEWVASVVRWFLNIFFQDINFVHFSPQIETSYSGIALSLELAPGVISIVTSL